MPEPAHQWIPPYRSTNGDLAADVGARVGMTPDEDQRAILNAMFAEDVPGHPVCREVAVVAPRQNIKTSTLLIAALADLFVFEVPLVYWTAHLFPTARKTFEQMWQLLDKTPEYRQHCRWPPRTANGNEKIELLSGQAIEFHARQGGAGRGFTGGKIVLDEALFLDDGMMGALMPVLATRPEAQVRYGSSAGKGQSAVLRGVRDRGRARNDPTLAYFEWAAQRVACQTKDCVHQLGAVGCALDREDLWAEANPALGRRISLDMMRFLRRSMPALEFAREFLSWWDEPEESEGAFATALWTSLADPDARHTTERVLFALDVAPDMSTATIAVGWERPDGAPQVMLADHRPGTEWVPRRAAELVGAWGGQLLLEQTGTGAFLLPDLEREGVPVELQTRRYFVEACGTWSQAFTTSRLHHGNQPELNAAVAAARWLGPSETGTRAWSRKEPIVSPLVAAALVVHGLAIGLESVYEERGMVIL